MPGTDLLNAEQRAAIKQGVLDVVSGTAGQREVTLHRRLGGARAFGESIKGSTDDDKLLEAWVVDPASTKSVETPDTVDVEHDLMLMFAFDYLAEQGIDLGEAAKFRRSDEWTVDAIRYRTVGSWHRAQDGADYTTVIVMLEEMNTGANT